MESDNSYVSPAVSDKNSLSVRSSFRSKIKLQAFSSDYIEIRLSSEKKFVFTASAVFVVAGVCPSVCPSVGLTRSCVVSIRLKISSKTSFRRGSPIILFFFDFERLYPIPRVSAGAKYTGAYFGKHCDFRPKSPFILETVRDRPTVTMGG